MQFRISPSLPSPMNGGGVPKPAIPSLPTSGEGRGGEWWKLLTDNALEALAPHAASSTQFL